MRNFRYLIGTISIFLITFVGNDMFSQNFSRL
nr:MAG TPA: hypothetical protein [Caudoviricetes sp.]